MTPSNHHDYKALAHSEDPNLTADDTGTPFNPAPPTSKTFTLEQAIAQAVHCHQGQVDKQGEPYILHVLRVMLAVSPRARVVAVLHDTLEDTEISEALLAHRLTRTEHKALRVVTRPAQGSPARGTYRDYIWAIANWPGQSGEIAREVKVADLHDNFDRLGGVSDSDLYRRYADALAVLEGACCCGVKCWRVGGEAACNRVIA